MEESKNDKQDDEADALGEQDDVASRKKKKKQLVPIAQGNIRAGTKKSLRI